MTINSVAELKREFLTRAQQCGLQCEVLGNGNFNAEVVLVGEFPGFSEVQLKEPFVGTSGRHLWDTLRRYGITRQHVYSTNVIKRQVVTRDDGKDTVEKNELSHWEGLLDWELSCLPNARYFVVLGARALTALTGERGITSWRGSVLYRNERVYICTFNPAMVLREPKWEVIFGFDIAKLDRVMKGTYKSHDIAPIINPSYLEAVQWIDKMHDDGLAIAYDIEVISDETACVGLTNNNHTGMCISWRDRTRNIYSTHEELDLRRRLDRLFTSDPVQLVAQNGAFDAGWLGYKDRIRVKRAWIDTLLAHHTLYPQLPHSLGFLTSQYTTHPYYKDEGKDWREGGDIDQFWEYNVKDCCITRTAAFRMLTELQDQKLDKFFFNHVMRLQPHLINMTISGVLVDEELKERISIDLGAEVQRLKDEFHRAVADATGDPDYKPNPRSPPQLRELFFNQLRLVGRGHSTDDDNRKRFLAHPRTGPAAARVIHTLNKFIEEAKFFSTYVESAQDEDHKFRCDWKQYGTASAPGRLSSTQTLWHSGGNLQNQTERSKPMFVAEEGYRFLYFDLSQAEARVVSVVGNVTGLRENFELAKEKGVDVHRANAARIFKLPIEEIPTFDWWEYGKNTDDRAMDHKPTKRYLGKRCVHGLNYRMGPDKLAEVCQISISDATQAHHSYHRAFPEIQQWWDATIQEVYRTKELWSAFGRRLKFLGRLPDRKSQDGTASGVLDSIVAFNPQSTIGDKVCSVIYDAHEDEQWQYLDRHSRLGGRVCINVHDALIVRVPDDDDTALEYAKVLKKYAEAPIMIRGYPLSIPADFKWSYKCSFGAEKGMFVPDPNGLHRWSNMKGIKVA